MSAALHGAVVGTATASGAAGGHYPPAPGEHGQKIVSSDNVTRAHWPYTSSPVTEPGRGRF